QVFARFGRVSVFMDRERIDRWCEHGILGLVLAIVVFGPLAMGAARLSEFLVIQGLTVALAILWGTRIWLNRRPEILWPPVCWGVAVFVVYAFVRYQQADIEYVARQEWLRIVVCATLYFAAANNLRRASHVQAFVVVLTLLATVLSIFAVYQF